jgi:PAS domain S-box-containing protein
MNPLNFTDLAEALFEEAGDALFLFDPDSDEILAVNAVGLRLSGFSRHELLKMPVTWLYRFDGRSSHARLRSASQRSGVFHNQDGFELRTREDNVWVPVNLTITRLHVQPKTLALITARDVREQRQAHNRIKRIETELRRVLESVSDCIWSAEIDSHGQWTYRYVSPVIEKLTGRVADFFFGGAKHWWTVVSPEDRPRCERAVRHWRKGQSSQEEYRIVRPDGASRWVRDSVLASVGATSTGKATGVRLDGILTDITDRRMAEEALGRERALLRSLIDSIPDLIVYKDREGRIFGCNAAFEASLGQREKDLIGCTDFEMFADEVARSNQEQEHQVLAAGQLRRAEEVACFPDGKSALMDVLRTPFFGPEGQLLGLIAISRDITERKQAEEMLIKTIASERAAHQQLKLAQSQLVQSEKLAALGQLVAGVAHEINNPLAFVSNNTVVLQRDLKSLRELLAMYREAAPLLAQHAPALQERIGAFCDHIDLEYTLTNIDGILTRTREGLQRIQHIVKGLRDFARLDESDLKETNLNAGIESTINILRGEAKKKHLTLGLELSPLPEVICYPARINQVVLNLVMNAIYACPESGTVIVRTHTEPGGVAIHVLDNGCGIEATLLERIFDPFFTTKPVGQGTGLGLSISHQIVEDHGGHIEVESTVGRGTHFTVHLPLRATPRSARKPSDGDLRD